MEDLKPTLIVLLSMHRCGSSLTTSILQRLGMSLGPFSLNGAAPSNPYGHFESMPFMMLNRRVQELALGFGDDLPETPESLAQLCRTRGEWPGDVEIPDELIEEGRGLIRALVSSGRVSGFKDPRTVLTWPFWARVLSDFSDLRIIPLNLLRSPHEIAMSLVSRREGWCGYWDALDVVATHFHQQKAILERWPTRYPSLCFGSSSYLESIESVARQCGLTWDLELVLGTFDSSCVHHSPATVPHVSQEIFEALCQEPDEPLDPAMNRDRLEHDARWLEAGRLKQWSEAQEQVSLYSDQARHERIRADTAEALGRGVSAELEIQRSSALEAHERCDPMRLQLAATLAYLVRVQSELHKTRLQLAKEVERSEEFQHENIELRDQIAKFASHPVLGPALWGRRQLRRMIHTVVTSP